MVKTRSQRAAEVRVLNDLCLTFKINEIREDVFGSKVMMREEINNEDMDIALGLLKACGVSGTPDASNISMASISCCAKADKADLVGQLTPVIGVRDGEDTVDELIEWPRLKGSLVECPTRSSRFREFCKAKSSIDGIWGHAFAYRVILVCETLNGRWAASGSERKITAKDFLEYYVVKYVTATDGAYLSSSSSRPYFFDLSSAGRVWSDNLLWVSGECLQRSDVEPLELNNRTITKGINYKVSRKDSFIVVVAREGTELEAVLKELEISRFERVASKDNKVRRSQPNRRLAGKTLSSMEKKLSTPELNTPLKLARLNEIPDGPWTWPRSLALFVDDSSKRRKVTSSTKSQEVLEESDKIDEGADLRPHFEVEVGLLEEQCRAKAREKMVAVMDDEFKKFARALRNVQLGFQDRSMELEKRISQLEGEKNQLEGNLTRESGAIGYRVCYFLEQPCKEALPAEDEEEVEEREDGLNVTEKTATDNQETIKQEIESSPLRVVDLEGLLEVEKKSSAELQEKATSGSRHEVELAEYRIRALNEEISDMKCNICALNEQLLKREIELDTTGTNLAVSNTDFEKLSSSIMGKDRELHNSAQICDSLIARLDRVKADLRRLKGRKIQSRDDLTEIQAKTKAWWMIWPTLVET
ncbi:hypothetical protein GIB67_043099 [Kingdonia uniflora]|uniref:Uncharacterized protein n=1 Tax=Kingdonia uniflora TaxID=39325 RepID=A0A7J7LW56_9MAGN|nr:hypothetical protein GIB67_043099 [Kingdonia uniflora]